jgi:hypothetical protein
VDIRVFPGDFEGPLTALGSGSFCVEVGGISVRFEGLPDGLLAAALERYGPFLSDAAPAHTVRLFEGDEHYLDMAEDKFLRLEERETPVGRILVSHVFAALRPSADAPGAIRLSSAQPLRNSLGALENYLRWVIADLALEHDGFVIHSAGLVRGGRAHLFFGHSGAGKSTATALSVESAGAVALSDDLVLVLKRFDGYVAVATPFWGSLPQQVKERGTYPLAGLYSLRQAPEVAMNLIAPGLAAGMVLSCCPFVSDAARRMERLLPLVEHLCREVPVYELFFKKDPSFWEVVTPFEVTA